MTRLCVLGVGGGGFHFEIEHLISQLTEPVELILVYTIASQIDANWTTPPPVRRAFVVRSPALLHDSWIKRVSLFVAALFRAAAILVATKPDAIVAVGTAQSVPFGLVARLTRTPMCFVESITRVHGRSRTARIVSALWLARRQYVQWPHLQQPPRAIFRGSVIS